MGTMYNKYSYFNTPVLSPSEITFNFTPYSSQGVIANGVGTSGSSNVSVTVMSFTAVGKVKVTIAPFKIKTNTSSNEGRFWVYVNNHQSYVKTLTTDTWITLNDMPTFELADGETLECKVGFVNSHSNCYYYVTTV